MLPGMELMIAGSGADDCRFNAIAFYLDMTDMLAREGL